MKLARLQRFSLCLNLVLGVVTGYLLQSRTNIQNTPVAHETSTTSSVVVLPQSEGPPGTSLLDSKLVWHALESTNYSIYIQNLRSVSCPEETIRDIVAADVHKLYLEKRAALLNREKFQYWATASTAEHAKRQTQDQIETLNAEEQAVLQNLFGRDWRQDYAKANPQLDIEENIYGNLPEGKREKIRDVIKVFENAEKTASESLSAGNFSEEDLSRLQGIRKGRRQALAEILTPEQLEDYELRNSDTAQNLRSALAGLSLNQKDFLSIYHLQKAFDEEYGSQIESVDQLYLKRRAGAQAQLDSEIKRILGEERFAELQRGEDP